MNKPRFTKPIGPKLTKEDLELYARELNQGPSKGWYVAMQEQGDGSKKWALARQMAS